MEPYKTELRNKNRGYMNLIVWQKAMDLFELVWNITYVESRIDFKLRAQVADATIGARHGHILPRRYE